LASIDFTNIIKDYEGSYLSRDQIYSMKDYWRKRAYNTRSPKMKLKYLKKGLLILTCYRCGRRVSELIGNNIKLDRYPGLRPIDFIDKDFIIGFNILKKQHVRHRNSLGAKRSEERVLKEQINKRPKLIRVAVDKGIYNILKTFINKYNILPTQRLFPFCRSTCDNDIKEAALKCGIVLPGTRTLKHRITKQDYKINKKVHFHMLRHSYAIHLINSNKNNPQILPMLQDALCHSSINTTKTYMQFNQEDRINVLTNTFAPESLEEEAISNKVKEPVHEEDE